MALAPCVFSVRTILWHDGGVAVLSRFDGGVEGTVLRGLVLLCPSHPLDTAVLSRSDGGGEGRVLRGLVLLCHLLPPSLIMLRFLVLTVEGKV